MAEQTEVRAEGRELNSTLRKVMRWVLRLAVLAAFVGATIVFYSLLTQAGVIGERVVVDEPVFEDVAVDSPFRQPIEEVSELGIMGGISTGLFAPEDPVTRGQFATVLAKAMEWKVTADEKQPFADVENKPVQDTADYIAVVYQRQVMTGRPGDQPTFGPEEQMSLEQAMVATVRAGGDELRTPITPNAAIQAQSYSQTLKDALQVARSNGLLTGTGIDPEVTDFSAAVQRQQLAALLVNLRTALRL